MKALLTLSKQLALTFLLAILSVPLWATTCANAINIIALPVINQALVCGAGNDLNNTTAPAICGSATSSYKGGNEALYTFTPTSSGNYDISISGQTWTSIFVFAGCPTSGGTCVNSVGSSASAKSLSVSLTAGIQYFIWFDTWPTPNSPCPGTFSMSLAAPPPSNDECAGAIPLTVGSSCSFTQFTNATATSSVGPPAPGCASYSGGDVWFSVVVPASGRLIIDSNTGVVTDGGMAIYSGSCGALSLIECDDDDSANGLMPFIDRSGLTPGSTIYIRFWEFGNDNRGTFSICVYNPVPPCSAPGTPSASSVSTNSAVLSWAAGSGATSYDWSVGTGVSCPNGATANTTSTSVNLSGLTPNTTYTFCVRTSTCSSGGTASSYVSTSFTTAPLPNDNCPGAQTVTCGQTVTGNTTGATSDSGVGSCGSGGSPGNGLWYKLTGNGAQVTLDLCGSAYDTKVHVYSGACGSLTCVGSNDDSPTCGTTRSRFVFNASVGVDYYILVSGFSSATGAFSMNISCICGPALGAPWTVTNIGASNGGAIDNVCDGTIDVSASNYGSPTSDVQTYAWQQLCGDGFIKAKLNNVTNGGWGGLMFRESSAPGSRKIAIRSQLTSAVVRDLRAATNGVQQQQQFPRPNTPQWLRLTRNGNIFTGEVSIDGTNWDVVFVNTLALPSCIQVGLFTQSINVNTTATAVFSNIMGVALFNPQIPLVRADNDTEVESIGFGLFPNPATDEVNIKLPGYIGKQVQIAVYNNVGQAVIIREIDEVQDAIERLPLNELATGVYFVTVRSEGVPMQTQKLIVGSPRP